MKSQVVGVREREKLPLISKHTQKRSTDLAMEFGYLRWC